MTLDAWSKHHTGGEYNEHHEAIGFECNNPNVMYFKNSYDRSSLGRGSGLGVGARPGRRLRCVVERLLRPGVHVLGIIPVAAPRITFSLAAEVSVLPTPYVSVVRGMEVQMIG